MKSPLAALVSFLLADAGVSALVATRVFGGRPDRPTAEMMPVKAVVLVYASGNTENADMPINRRRIDARCYGETDFEAEKVLNAVYQALKRVAHKTVVSTLIQSVTKSAGPIPIIDTDLNDAPVLIDSWSVIASDDAVAA